LNRDCNFNWVGSSFEGSIFHPCLYFVLYKNKKDNDYKMFTNVLFNNEKTAEEFGRKSMKRGFEHKVVEYNEDNHERYWYK
jgi:hypothetical protein